MWQISGVAPIPWPARLWPRWSKLHVEENVTGFLQLSSYQLFGKPPHHPCGTQHGWFWHIGCSWLLSILHQSSWTKFAKFFWKLSLGEPNGHHLGKDFLCPNGRSLGQGLAPASWPQIFSGSGGLGPEPLLVYVFFHWQSRKGRNPNLWRVSGMWNCQCHFFIKDISGKAWWKVWMACSTAGNKVVMVMRPAWFPSWTWSMKAAIARKKLGKLQVYDLWALLHCGWNAWWLGTWPNTQKPGKKFFHFAYGWSFFSWKSSCQCVGSSNSWENPMGKIAF